MVAICGCVRSDPPRLTVVGHWGPQKLVDAFGSRGQHRHAIEAERASGCIWCQTHGSDTMTDTLNNIQRGQEVLVDRIAFPVDALLLRHLGLEPLALLYRVGQLAEAVGQLDTTDIELEALG